MTKKKNRKPGNLNSGPVVITPPTAHLSINELVAAHDPVALAYLKGFDDCIQGRRSGFPDIPENNESRRLIIIAIQAKSFWRTQAAVITNAKLEHAQRGPRAGKRTKAETHRRIAEIWTTETDKRGRRPSAEKISMNHPELKMKPGAIAKALERLRKSGQIDLSKTN